MTASSNRRPRRARFNASAAAVALFLAAGLSLTVADCASAQVGAPTVLGPAPAVNDRPSEGAAPDKPAPGPALRPAPRLAPPSSAAKPGDSPSGIEVAPLPTARTDYAGVLGSGEGGLGIEMWRGTSHALVARLLPNLPATTRSPAMRHLMRRLLLSSAVAPAGEAEGRNLMSLRAERVAAMGDLRGAANLLRLIPEQDMDATAARLTVDALLLSNDLDGACAEIRRWIGRFEDTYWQKALIFCQTRAGETDEAALGLGLLRELGHADDQAFFSLIDTLSGVETAPLESLPAPTALHLAMLRAAGQAPPADILETEDPAQLAWAAANPDADPGFRLAAAERAAARGALTAEELARVYADLSLEPAEIDGALSLADKDSGPRSRAALYQAALRAEQTVARATLVQKALDSARDEGGYPVAVRLYLPLLAGIAPAPELSWFALDAGRALYLAGRHDLARQWLAPVQARAPQEPEAAAAASALWLLTRIAGGGEPLVWDAASVRAWRNNQAAGGDDQAGRRAARLFAVLEALDEPVGAAWQVLADGGPPEKQPLPDPALWFMIDDSAAARRLGETVLVALVGLGPDGPGETNPIILTRVLSSLRTVGLEPEARALALETAIANGV